MNPKTLPCLLQPGENHWMERLTEGRKDSRSLTRVHLHRGASTLKQHSAQPTSLPSYKENH